MAGWNTLVHPASKLQEEEDEKDWDGDSAFAKPAEEVTSEVRRRFPVSPSHVTEDLAAKFRELILFVKAGAPPCKCDGGTSGDDNDINWCPKTSPKKFPYFVPWASVGRAWHEHFYIGTIPTRTGQAKHGGYIHSSHWRTREKNGVFHMGRFTEQAWNLFAKDNVHGSSITLHPTYR